MASSDARVDPVCGMSVTAGREADSIEYNAVTYYFCSESCAKRFLADPDQYARRDAAASILTENLPTAWQDDATTALAIATALSQQAGNTLPWKTVHDVIGGAIQAKFIVLAEGSASWPCELSGASAVKIEMAPAQSGTGGGAGTGGGGGTPPTPNVRAASADFEPSQIQDLGDLIPAILDIKTKAGVPVRFHVRLEVGDGSVRAADEVVADINRVLDGLGDEFRLA